MRKKYQCRACGEEGHNRATCGKSTLPKLPKSRKPSNEEYRALLERKHPGISDLLGAVTDADIARTYRISRQRAHQFRTRLGIPSAFPSPFVPTKEQVSLLGTKSDLELSREWGVSATTVWRVRASHGIPPRPRNKDKLLEPFVNEAGKVSDSTLAEKAGVSTQAIFRFRKRKGITTQVVSPRHVDFVPIDRDKVKELVLQGKTDEQIAKAVVSTKNYVAQLRQRMGLSKKKRPTYSNEDREKIFHEYQKCYNYSEVARRFGCSVNFVREVCAAKEEK
jgi:transposase-like protein